MVGRSPRISKNRLARNCTGLPGACSSISDRISRQPRRSGELPGRCRALIASTCAKLMRIGSLRSPSSPAAQVFSAARGRPATRRSGVQCGPAPPWVIHRVRARGRRPAGSAGVPRLASAEGGRAPAGSSGPHAADARRWLRRVGEPVHRVRARGHHTRRARLPARLHRHRRDDRSRRRPRAGAARGPGARGRSDRPAMLGAGRRSREMPGVADHPPLELTVRRAEYTPWTTTTQLRCVTTPEATP